MIKCPYCGGAIDFDRAHLIALDGHPEFFVCLGCEQEFVARAELRFVVRTWKMVEATP